VIAWDHLEQKAWVIGTAERTKWVRERLLAAPPAVRDDAVSVAHPPESNFTRAEYEAGVSRIREYIAAGDVYQVNLAQRFHAPFRSLPIAARSRAASAATRRNSGRAQRFFRRTMMS